MWGKYCDKLLDWMSGTSRVNEFFWLDRDDVDWWISCTMRSLASYSSLFSDGTDRERIFRWISRHVGTVFAPFDGEATRNQLIQLAASLPPERQQRYRSLLNDPQFDLEHLAEIRGVYWSWRLTDFANVDGSIVCKPMLALWSEWPSSAQWAPPSLANMEKRRQFTDADAEVARFLSETLWQRIESTFSIARNAFGLGVAEPEFAEKESQPPAFFFAAPVNVPVKPEEYAEELRPAIMPLVRSCLISADPLADQVAWALLEGDLVALRREISRVRTYQPRYLLLPAYAKSSSAQPIEEDIGSVADRLTFLEFSIGHEARDVYTDWEPLAVRSGMWGGTLDLVNRVTGEAIDLLPSVHRSHLGRINERLTTLHLVLRRLQTSIEPSASDADQVLRKYTSYLDGTDDYFRARLPSSAVPRVTTLNLRDAIQHAYPYQYVKQPVESLQSIMAQLNSSIARISTSLSTILDLSDRRIQAFSSRLSGMFNFIIALLALLVGLAQILGTQDGIAAASSFGLLGPFFQSPELTSAARVLFEVVGLLLIAAALLYGLEWIFQRRPRRRPQFIVNVQRFRALASSAEAYIELAIATAKDEMWHKVDLLDDEAVDVLSHLWKELQRDVGAVGNSGTDQVARRVRPENVRAWELRSRVLEHAIELFALAPRTIVLPRSLCVLRFKSTDFRSRSAMSDWDFGISLRTIGYSSAEVATLSAWLSNYLNQQQIKVWDVATFAQILKAQGVTADPEKRAPERWYGPLAEQGPTR